MIKVHGSTPDCTHLQCSQYRSTAVLLRGVPICANLCQSMPICTAVPICTHLCQSVPICANLSHLYQSVPICTNLYQSVDFDLTRTTHNAHATRMNHPDIMVTSDQVLVVSHQVMWCSKSGGVSASAAHLVDDQQDSYFSAKVDVRGGVVAVQQNDRACLNRVPSAWRMGSFTS